MIDYAALSKLLAEARAEERERCAQLVEQYVCTTAYLKPLADQIRGEQPSAMRGEK